MRIQKGDSRVIVARRGKQGISGRNCGRYQSSIYTNAKAQYMRARQASRYRLGLKGL